MAAVSTTNTATQAMTSDEDQIGSGLINLESSATIYPGDAVYLTVVSGVFGVKLSGGTGFTALTDAVAVVDGFATKKSRAGQPITVHAFVTFGGLLSADASAIATYYLSDTTPGKLDTVAQVTNAKPIARVVGSNLVRMFPSYY